MELWIIFFIITFSSIVCIIIGSCIDSDSWIVTGITGVILFGILTSIVFLTTISIKSTTADTLDILNNLESDIYDIYSNVKNMEYNEITSILFVTLETHVDIYNDTLEDAISIRKNLLIDTSVYE